MTWCGGFWAHMGTSPVVLDWGDVYLSLKQGMVDAVTAPLTNVRPSRLTEVAPYVTELKQFHQTWPISVSEKVWQTLTAEQPADPDRRRQRRDQGPGAGGPRPGGIRHPADDEGDRCSLSSG